MRDVLLYGASRADALGQLLDWKRDTPDLHEFVPDFHRLQLEHWIWTNRLGLGRHIIDVGVDVGHPRRWLGADYRTLGLSGEDIYGDLLDLPLNDDSVDGFVVTEVLEHCTDPHSAMAEIHRALKPGGRLLITSPFFWPQHATTNYQDYWRFTDQGWTLLLGGFVDVTITPCAWTPEGLWAYEFMRVFECFGFSDSVAATTGYLCEARKPSAP